MSKKFCCQISPEINNLEKLNKDYGWIPGKENIRPSEKVLKEKEKYLENISTFYQEERDYVLCEIFDFKHSINKEGKIYVKNKDIKREKMFCKNIFPYQVPELTQHYVMWYSYDIIDETEINNDITYQIQKLSNSTLSIKVVINEGFTITQYPTF